MELSTASDKAPRILIADDDPSIVDLLADRCARMGFVVETASNGIQALLKARRNAPAVLIIDVNMPGVDGLSVCTRLLAGADALLAGDLALFGVGALALTLAQTMFRRELLFERR